MPRMMVPGRAQLQVRQRPALVQRVLPHRVPGAEDEAEAAEDAEDDGGDVDHFFSFSGVCVWCVFVYGMRVVYRRRWLGEAGELGEEREIWCESIIWHKDNEGFL